jgi:putative glutamine amidotransferase
MKPLIGITAGEITNKYGKWAPHTHGQSYTYVDSIIHAGGVPVILPITGDESVWEQYYARCDGLLFAGGNDIDPSRYGQRRTRKTVSVSKFRDAQEFALMSIALRGDKPMLAICRGMQLLNIAKGGSLVQHIPDSFVGAQDHCSSTSEKDTTHRAHMLKIAPDSQLAQTLGVTNIATNSHHHQAVDTLGEGLVATAWAEDGVVEGLESSDKKYVLGVQSHPESLEASAVPEWSGLFRALVAAARTS